MRNTFSYELKYYFKNKKEIIVISTLFIAFFILAPFTLRDNLKLAPLMGNSLLWLAMLSAYSLSGIGLYERDRLAGRLEYYQLQPRGLEWTVLAKWLANYLAILLPILFILPTVMLLFGFESAHMVLMVIGLVVGGATLSAISNLGAALMAGLGQGAGAILGLLVLPLSVPVVIFGSDYISTGNIASLGLVAGIGLFLVPVLALAGASGIRSSN